MAGSFPPFRRSGTEGQGLKPLHEEFDQYLGRMMHPSYPTDLLRSNSKASANRTTDSHSSKSPTAFSCNVPNTLCSCVTRPSASPTIGGATSADEGLADCASPLLSALELDPIVAVHANSCAACLLLLSLFCAAKLRTNLERMEADVLDSCGHHGAFCR